MKSNKKTCEVAMHFNKTPNTFSDFTFQCIDKILTSSNQDTNIGATNIRVWIYKCSSILFLGAPFFFFGASCCCCCFFWRDVFSLVQPFFLFCFFLFLICFLAQLFFFGAIQDSFFGTTVFLWPDKYWCHKHARMDI